MQKQTRIVLIPILCILLFGCSHPENSDQPETTVVVTETLQEEPLFTFSLPEEYTISAESRSSVIIEKDRTRIGGVLLTNLDTDCIHNSDCLHVDKYLRLIAPMPKRVEYIITYQDNDAYISLTITDTETGQVFDQSHQVFDKDSAYFDFWVDTSIVSNDERDTLFASINESLAFQ